MLCVSEDFDVVVKVWPHKLVRICTWYFSSKKRKTGYVWKWHPVVP